jgi:hypothetical protein
LGGLGVGAETAIRHDFPVVDQSEFSSLLCRRFRTAVGQTSRRDDVEIPILALLVGAWSSAAQTFLAASGTPLPRPLKAPRVAGKSGLRQASTDKIASQWTRRGWARRARVCFSNPTIAMCQDADSIMASGRGARLGHCRAQIHMAIRLTGSSTANPDKMSLARKTPLIEPPGLHPMQNPAVSPAGPGRWDPLFLIRNKVALSNE